MSDTKPTALVVVNADIAEITSVPGCSEIHLGHHAVEGRTHDGVIKLTLHFVDLCLGLHVARRLFDRQIGIAAQFSEVDLRGLL